MKLTHVRLLVSNYGECFRFYRDVLGLEAGFGEETSDYADFAAGPGSIVALFDRDEQAEVVEVREPGDAAMQVFEVDDVDTAAARFRDHLATAPQSRPEWGIRFVHLRDPAGNVIELNQAIPMEDG